MVCNNCYYNNDDDSKFCVKCGTKLKQKVIIKVLYQITNDMAECDRK